MSLELPKVAVARKRYQSVSLRPQPHLPHLLALPLGDILLQGATQGLLSGTLSTIAYNWIVILLGAGRAVLFPALVPGLAILFGIPILGELPTLVQLLGLAAAMTGLLIALGIIRLPVFR